MILDILHTLISIVRQLILARKLGHDSTIIGHGASHGDIAALEQHINIGVAALDGTAEFVVQGRVHEFKGRVGPCGWEVANVVVVARDEVGGGTPVESVDPGVDFEAVVGEPGGGG